MTTLVGGFLIRSFFRSFVPGTIERTTSWNNQKRITTSTHQPAFEIVTSIQVTVLMRDDCRDLVS